MACDVAIFKADEVIYHFDDKVSFTSEIAPGLAMDYEAHAQGARGEKI